MSTEWKMETQGPYEARIAPGGAFRLPELYGVVSLSEGREICRVWREKDARVIAAMLSAAPDALGETVGWASERAVQKLKDGSPTTVSPRRDDDFGESIPLYTHPAPAQPVVKVKALDLNNVLRTAFFAGRGYDPKETSKLTEEDIAAWCAYDDPSAALERVTAALYPSRVALEPAPSLSTIRGEAPARTYEVVEQTPIGFRYRLPGHRWDFSDVDSSIARGHYQGLEVEAVYSVNTVDALNAQVARLSDLVDKYKWQVRDTCKRAEAAEVERDGLKANTAALRSLKEGK